ncbi:hypothetical protein [Streptomyces sp. NPDC093071]
MLFVLGLATHPLLDAPDPDNPDNPDDHAPAATPSAVPHRIAAAL